MFAYTRRNLGSFNPTEGGKTGATHKQIGNGDKEHEETHHSYQIKYFLDHKCLVRTAQAGINIEAIGKVLNNSGSACLIKMEQGVCSMRLIEYAQSAIIFASVEFSFFNIGNRRIDILYHVKCFYRITGNTRSPYTCQVSVFIKVSKHNTGIAANDAPVRNYSRCHACGESCADRHCSIGSRLLCRCYFGASFGIRSLCRFNCLVVFVAEIYKCVGRGLAAHRVTHDANSVQINIVHNSTCNILHKSDHAQAVFRGCRSVFFMGAGGKTVIVCIHSNDHNSTSGQLDAGCILNFCTVQPSMACHNYGNFVLRGCVLGNKSKCVQRLLLLGKDSNILNLHRPKIGL